MDTKHPSADHTSPAYSLWDLVLYALRLGAFGFGGPVALAGYMHRDLVEQRKWISATDYKEGLTLAQLMPGSLAAQLAIYLGFIHYKITGATLVGIAFVLPPFLMVVALGAAYLAYGGLSRMQSVFYGVGTAVTGIIAISAYKVTSTDCQVADSAKLELAPQAPRLAAVSLGLSRIFPNDHQMLKHGVVLYDAFYAWCREGQDEVHTWNPEAYC